MFVFCWSRNMITFAFVHSIAWCLLSCDNEDVLSSRLVSGSESSLTSLLLGFLNIPISFFLHHRLLDGALVCPSIHIVGMYLYYTMLIRWRRSFVGIISSMTRYHTLLVVSGIGASFKFYHVPDALYPWEIHGTHFTGSWVGPRAGLDGRKISSARGFDPGPSIP